MKWIFESVCCVWKWKTVCGLIWAFIACSWRYLRFHKVYARLDLYIRLEIKWHFCSIIILCFILSHSRSSKCRGASTFRSVCAAALCMPQCVKWNQTLVDIIKCVKIPFASSTAQIAETSFASPDPVHLWSGKWTIHCQIQSTNEYGYDSTDYNSFRNTKFVLSVTNWSSNRTRKRTENDYVKVRMPSRIPCYFTQIIDASVNAKSMKTKNKLRLSNYSDLDLRNLCLLSERIDTHIRRSDTDARPINTDYEITNFIRNENSFSVYSPSVIRE